MQPRATILLTRTVEYYQSKYREISQGLIGCFSITLFADLNDIIRNDSQEKDVQLMSTMSNTMPVDYLRPLLLTWIHFNPSMDESSHVQ